MKNATFRQLRVFTEVAKHLSFARAAEVLHLTPPAVTMQVKELEGHVGLPLFERNGRQVALTTAGEYMLVYARKVLATLKDAEDAAARLQRLEVGTLTIGMVSTAKYFLPRLLAEFQRDHEGIEIKLAVGNREQLVKMLHGNEVDIAIMGRPPTELATRAEPFAAHPHVFVAPVDHPLLKVGHPTVDSLKPYGFILRERGSGTRAALEYLRREMLAPEGGFYSAQDADTPTPDGGVEGLTFTWTPAEVRAVLGDADGDLLCRHLGVRRMDAEVHALAFSIASLVMPMWTQRDALEAIAPQLARPLWLKLSSLTAATPACRPSCSPTGAVHAHGAAPSAWKPWSSAKPMTPHASTACTTGARCKWARKPTSTSSITTSCGCTPPRWSTTCPQADGA